MDIAGTLSSYKAQEWYRFCAADNDKLVDEVSFVVSRVTNIPLDDLRSFQPGTNRIREKMNWAATRETTRVENVAYSLSGIFDVNLTVAYGEGNRAFFRLMEAVIQRYDHWEIFTWEGDCSPYNSALPASPNCYPPFSKPDPDHESMGIDLGDKTFSLTNHGLRIQLLAEPMQVVSRDVVEESELDEVEERIVLMSSLWGCENVVARWDNVPSFTLDG